MLLDINTELLIFTIITFLLLLIVLGKFAWKPLLAMLDERENRIREALAQADQAREEAREQTEENKRALAQAQADAQGAIAKAREDAERVARELHERAEGEAQQLLAQAQRTIQQERDKALQELRQQTAELAVLAAGRLLEETLDDDRSRKIVDDFISRIPDARQN